MGSVIHTAEHAVDQTRSSLVDLGAQALKLVNSLKAAEGRSVDSMLHRIGLQRRDEAPTPLLWFAAGAIAAGAVVFMLAPESGKKLRGRIAELWESRGAHAAKPGNVVTSKADGVEQNLAH